VRRRALLCLAWLVTVGAGALLVLSLAPDAGAKPKSCGPIPDPRPAEALPPAAADLGLYQKEGSNAVRIGFGESRQPDIRRIMLGAYDGALTSTRGLDVKLGSGYVHGDDGRTISLNDPKGDGLYANLSVIDAHTLQLCVEVRPKEITEFHAGRYTGMIAIVAGKKQLALTAIPIELTFRAPFWGATRFALFGVLLGLLVKAVSETAGIPHRTEPRAWRPLWAYVTQPVFLAVAIVAFVTAIGVFSQAYGGNPVWGANTFGDAAKLLGACFAAPLGTVEGVDLANRIRKNRGGS